MPTGNAFALVLAMHGHEAGHEASWVAAYVSTDIILQDEGS